jgi:hypothetical protein
MKKIIVIFLLFFSWHQAKAFDASPFNTQSAELSQGGWWTVYHEFFYAGTTNSHNPLSLELRYTFFDKIRFGVLNSLSYYNDANNSYLGLSNFLLTTELEVYDFEKNDFLKFANLELVDHANIFFNQFIPNLDHKELGYEFYSFNTGIEWQKQLSKQFGFYSELGYFYIPTSADFVTHNFLYNNSLSYEFNSWLQPYIELLGLTDFSTGNTYLYLAPGISIDFNDNIYLYANPIFNLTANDDTWGFQFGVTGNI